MIDLKEGPTQDRVYGGDPRLIHVPDGKRAALGKRVARFMDEAMRHGAENRTQFETLTQPLCPGCAMVVAFNMLVYLADNNDQSRTELARSMKIAFEKLERNPSQLMIEEIEVQLDPC